MIRQRIVAGLVAGVAVIGLAACGSDSESSDTTAAKATTTTAEEATATTAQTGNGSATTVASGQSLPMVTTGEATGECIQLEQDLQSSLGVSDIDDLDPEKMDDAFTEMKARVPSDLKDDVDTLSTAAKPFLTAIAEAGNDPTKAMQDPEVQEAMQNMSSVEVQEATNNLNTWFNEGCPS